MFHFKKSIKIVVKSFKNVNSFDCVLSKGRAIATNNWHIFSHIAPLLLQAISTILLQSHHDDAIQDYASYDRFLPFHELFPR